MTRPNIIFSVNRFPCYGEAQECNMWEEKYQPGYSSSHDWQVFNILIISKSFAIVHTNISRFWPILTNISTFIFKPDTGLKSWNYLYCILPILFKITACLEFLHTGDVECLNGLQLKYANKTYSYRYCNM